MINMYLNQQSKRYFSKHLFNLVMSQYPNLNIDFNGKSLLNGKTYPKRNNLFHLQWGKILLLVGSYRKPKVLQKFPLDGCCL